jgi:hypothetical protein
MHFQNIKITSISPWSPVDQIPTKNSKYYETMLKKYGKSGAYQIALAEDVADIGENFIHPNIGYIGKAGDILDRTYSVRAPKGKHGAARFIRQNGLDRSKVLIRNLYTSYEDFPTLEKALQNEMISRFGYSFKWSAASDGTRGNSSTILDIASRLPSNELLVVVKAIKEIAAAKAQEEFQLQWNNEVIAK